MATDEPQLPAGLVETRRTPLFDFRSLPDALALASNGEIVPITPSPVVAGECSWHSATADAAAPCEHGSGPGPSASRDATG